MLAAMDASAKPGNPIVFFDVTLGGKSPFRTCPLCGLIWHYNPAFKRLKFFESRDFGLSKDDLVTSVLPLDLLDLICTVIISLRDVQ